ncbi:MAG: MBL fold metallo-hydrolase [Spirochaetes bacterium]|nr:MBL fold metallo-hydrolase [Spirochaetota bacterium]
MNVCREKYFGEVEAFEMGYGPIGPPLMNVFFYLVDGLLVDTGQSRMKNAFNSLLERASVGKAVLTHHHEDHTGNAAELIRTKGVPVYGHPVTVEKMAAGFRVLPYQRIIWGPAPPARLLPVPEVVETDNYRFEAIHTPGHSRDHMAYLERKNGWLFSGDLFLGTQIKYFRADEKLDEEIASLRKVSRLEFDSLFCAVRPAVTGGKGMIVKKLEFLENLYGEVAALVEKGYTDEAVLRRYRHREIRFVKYFTFGNVSFRNMILSALTAVRSKAEGS